MLNQTTRYPRSVLCYLANRGPDRVPARQVAAETGTPANSWPRSGHARQAWRGDGGEGLGRGYTLALGATEVPLDELLILFDGQPVPVGCPFPEPICGCRMAREHGLAQAAAVNRLGPLAAGKVACSYGAECASPIPCPSRPTGGRCERGSRDFRGPGSGT